MEIKDKVENPAKIVNELIKESFGKRWKGTVELCANLVTIENWDRPQLIFIHEKKMLGELAGRLGARYLYADGSIIAVFPEYKDKAMRYCQLYEDFFKRKTKLFITDIEHIGDNDENFFGFKEYHPSDKENEITKNPYSRKLFLQKKAGGIEEAIRSLDISENGILTSNGYQNEEEKRKEYLEIAKTLSLETRSLLIDKLNEGISFFRISEEKNPQSIKKYFERFGAPIETISDLELFYESLLEIKN